MPSHTEEVLKDHSMFLQKPECDFLDHHPVWDGNYYTCHDCGLEFRSIKSIKELLTSTLQNRDKELVAELDQLWVDNHGEPGVFEKAFGEWLNDKVDHLQGNTE